MYDILENLAKGTYNFISGRGPRMALIRNMHNEDWLNPDQCKLNQNSVDSNNN